MKKALNARFIEALKPAIKRYEVRDTSYPGLSVRVSPNGQRRWSANYRYGTKQRRVDLGTYPQTTLARAREKVLEILRQVDDGKDPSLSRRMVEFRVNHVIDDFVEHYAKVKTRSWKQTLSVLKRELGQRYGERDIRTLERAEVLLMLDQTIARGAPLHANRLLSTVHKMFNWCVERGIIERNPASGIRKPTKEVARDRVLDDSELGRIIPMCRAEGYPFGDLFLFILATGQRRTECTHMRWSEIDWEAGVWRLPAERAKNGHAHAIPLSPYARDILHAAPRFTTSDFVFTTTARTPVSGWGKPKERLNVNTGVTGWTLHDLRRTAASGMARLQVAPHVIEKVLNHVSGIVSGVAAVYNRYGYDREKREALDLWSTHLQELE